MLMSGRAVSQAEADMEPGAVGRRLEILGPALNQNLALYFICRKVGMSDRQAGRQVAKTCVGWRPAAPCHLGCGRRPPDLP